jgi:DNA-binding NarL/FixJ family response regulator
MITIVIADEHKLLRQGLARLIADDERLQLVGEADSNQAAIDLIQKLQPQVAVLGVSMSGVNGFEITARLCAEMCTTKCIIFTEIAAVETVFRALDIGVAGIIQKKCGYEEFSDAIVKVAAGKIYLGEYQSCNRGAAMNGNLMISRREIEVVQSVVRGFTSRQIAEKLFISCRTVETHRRNVMKKLHINTVAELAVYAHKHGYM